MSTHFSQIAFEDAYEYLYLNETNVIARYVSYLTRNGNFDDFKVNLFVHVMRNRGNISFHPYTCSVYDVMLKTIESQVTTVSIARLSA